MYAMHLTLMAGRELLDRAEKPMQQNDEDVLSESDASTECTVDVERIEVNYAHVDSAENAGGMLMYHI